MTEQRDFKHISVAADDEEIVIQAGVLASDDAATRIADDEQDSVQDSAQAASDADAYIVDEREDDALQGESFPSNTIDGLRDDVLSEAGLSADDISEEARQEFEQHMRKSAARQEATRMITTEEDLHTAMPFARMQRIVVLVLALLIVAAVVYWFVRHPVM